GASRARIIRQLLTESVLLAALGGALGILGARWGATLLLLYLPEQGMVLDVSPDARVLGFTVAVSLATSLLFGLVPAWRATRLELTPGSREQGMPLGGGRSPFALSRLLVISQVALSLFL